MNYIDLGLPSGTLWADRNYGAAGVEHSGKLVSIADLGDKADLLPTEEQLKELLKHCKCDYGGWVGGNCSLDGGTRYDILTGPNGNSIRIQRCGCIDEKGEPNWNGFGGDAFWWSKTDAYLYGQKGKVILGLFRFQVPRLSLVRSVLGYKISARFVKSLKEN